MYFAGVCICRREKLRIAGSQPNTYKRITSWERLQHHSDHTCRCHFHLFIVRNPCIAQFAYHVELKIFQVQWSATFCNSNGPAQLQLMCRKDSRVGGKFWTQQKSEKPIILLEAPPGPKYERNTQMVGNTDVWRNEFLRADRNGTKRTRMPRSVSWLAHLEHPLRLRARHVRFWALLHCR